MKSNEYSLRSTSSAANASPLVCVNERLPFGSLRVSLHLAGLT